MRGYIFIAHGDITQLRCDAIAYSTSVWQRDHGRLRSAFAAHIPGFADAYDAARERQHAGRSALELGEAFWVPLGDTAPYGAVAVAATNGNQGDAEQAATCVVRAAIETALEHLRGPAPSTGTEAAVADTSPSHQQPQHRLLIALPAFRAGGGGDKFRLLPSAIAQIQAARQVLDQHEGVDVVFVTYQADIYDVFLEARRRAQATDEESRVAVPPELVAAIRNRECVFFIGAGLSLGSGMPGYPALLQTMAERLGLNRLASDDMDYGLDLAQWYDEAFPGDLARLIHDHFADTENRAKPSLAHYLLLALPVRYVVTTNYDPLIERTLDALRRQPAPVIHQEQVAQTGGRSAGVHVVKFHGDARTAKSSEDVVLTRDQYDAFFARRQAMAALLEGLLLNQQFFFLGYRLRDPNFRQIYHRIHALLDTAQRPAFATTLDPVHEHALRQWQQKGLHLLPMEGPARGDKQHHLLRFLDQLGEAVADTTRLFLAPEGSKGNAAGRQHSARLDELYAQLNRAGEAVIHAARRALAPEEVAPVARTLTFLTQQGWRPPKTAQISVARLWENLAERAACKEDQRQMLINALEHTESLERADKVRAKLRRLDQGDNDGSAQAPSACTDDARDLDVPAPRRSP